MLINLECEEQVCANTWIVKTTVWMTMYVSKIMWSGSNENMFVE